MSATVAMLTDAVPELRDFGNELFSSHLVEVCVHTSFSPRSACCPKPSAAWPPPAQSLSRSSSRHATRQTERPLPQDLGLSVCLALRKRRDASNRAACTAR